MALLLLRVVPIYAVPGRSIMEPSDLAIQFVITSAETRTRFSRSVRASASLEMRPRLNWLRTAQPLAMCYTFQMGRVIDLTGKRFDRLVVLTRSNNASDGAPRWRCRCDCGVEKDVRGATLRTSGAKSCGCLRRELGLRTITHGHTVGGKRSPTWKTWESMIERCT